MSAKLTLEQIRDSIEVGDRIKFRGHAAWNWRLNVRVVNGFDDNRSTVRLGGWPDFSVPLHLIGVIYKKNGKEIFVDDI